MDYAESSTAEVSDNDPSGHCGIVDNGLDHASDEGSDTGDDDPSLLPLLQATVYESCILAFEDLQNAGWCDWDMNDIVLDIHSYYVVNQSDEIESLVVTYQLLARGAGYESRMNLNLPFSGAAEWQRIYLNQAGEIEDTILGSGSDSASIVLWESSKDALPPYTGLKYQWGAARTERFDSSDPGKIAVVNIYFDSAASNPLEGFSESPHDTWAWIPNTHQAIHRLMYNPASSQTVYEGPFFGESLPFVAKFDSDFVWPHEGHAIWLSHPDYVDFVKSSGTANLGWMENFNKWRVWHDDAGLTHRGDDLTSVSQSVYYNNYVETHYSPL
jgi:LruC domain-containing protein